MDGELLAKIAESGLGWAVAAYLFVMLIREKDKRITEAKEDKTRYQRILTDLRNYVNTISKKAQNG